MNTVDDAPRRADAEIEAMFTDRWSPRAFSDRPLSTEQVSSLFEAARWAPSCYNEQPWSFVYATTPEELVAMRPVLVDANRRWADAAPFLALLFAKKSFAHNGKENKHAAFDCGAAWMSLALEARALGLYAHAMAGFSRKRAHALTGLDDEEYQALVAIAVGYRADAEVLPDDLREMERPNERRPRSALLRTGVTS